MEGGYKCARTKVSELGGLLGEDLAGRTPGTVVGVSGINLCGKGISERIAQVKGWVGP